MAHQENVFNTINYIWNSKDRLGYGATGSVYVGYHKLNGDRVAIKVFTGGTEFKSLKREIDVVQQLPRHENIVELITVEEDRKFHNKVIVMGLCTGGSLYEVIDSPENAYGLCEAEFKQVIYDVAKGLQHLRHHNFIHRDIKPGNIMRCKKADGSYIFKLADFGTARELGPNENFFSLHGTEEYLYPGMYERALINPQKKKDFSAKVDLWSVGATFFHAATGRLPFQPFRKRDDRHLMFKIISEKPSGVISGWQTVLNGEIDYRRELPKDLRISHGLSLLVTDVFARLMENDITKMFGFEDFFKQIEKIHWKKVIDVFCIHTCSCHQIFIDPDDNDGFLRLKEGIQMQTGLRVEHQGIFHENLPYQPTDRILASKLPVTTEERPLLVFGGDSLMPYELDSTTLSTIPSAPEGFALSNDLQYAKDCSKTLYFFKYRVEQLERAFRLMNQAALCFGYTVQQEHSILEQRLASIEQLNDATCRVLSSQVSGLHSLRDTMSAINEATSGRLQNEVLSLEEHTNIKEKQYSKVQGTPADIRVKIDKFKQDSLSPYATWDGKNGANVFHRSVESMHTMVSLVDKDFKTFQREKKHKSLNAYDQKVHQFTKSRLELRLSDAQVMVVRLLSTRAEVHSSLGQWLLKMIPLRTDIAELGQWMKKHAQQCRNLLDQSEQWEREHVKKLQEINQRIGGAVSQCSNQSKAPAQVEIPRDVRVKLIQSRNDLQQVLNEQTAKLESFKLISNN